MNRLRIVIRGACALALALLLGACGGGSASAPGQPTGQIHGISTPGSVSVVTATNADQAE